MNPNDWTNAIKAGVIALVNTGMALLMAVLVFTDITVDLNNFAILSVAVEAFVNSALGLWIAFTYRMSPSRIPDGEVAAKPSAVNSGTIVTVPPSTPGPDGLATVMSDGSLQAL